MFEAMKFNFRPIMSIAPKSTTQNAHTLNGSWRLRDKIDQAQGKIETLLTGLAVSCGTCCEFSFSVPILRSSNNNYYCIDCALPKLMHSSWKDP